MSVRHGLWRVKTRLAFAYALVLSGLACFSGISVASLNLAQRQACLSCHSVEKTVVGPSFFAIARQYKNTQGALPILMEKTRNGGVGVWGKIPMPPHAQIPETELRAIIQWILALEGEAPSFTCAQAVGEVERLICADDGLSKLDTELAAAYRSAQKMSSDGTVLKKEQISWLRNERDKCKTDRICLERSYKARIASLQRTSREGHFISPDHGAIPFQPRLVYEADKEVCGQVLNVAKRKFQSRMPVVSMNPTEGSQTTIDGWTWLDWQPLEDVEAAWQTGQLGKIELSFKGQKQSRLLVKHSFSHSWRGDNHYAAFFQSPDALKQALRKHTHGKEVDGAALLKQGRLYYPELSLTVPEIPYAIGFSEWEEHAVAKYRGRYFFFDEKNYFSRQSDTRRALLEIEPNGTIKPVCVLEVQPGEELTKSFLGLPGLRTYFQRLRTIGTGGVGWCGTLNSNVTHDARAEAALMRLGFRPWAVDISDSNYHHWNARTEQFLQEWANQWDAWSQREYFTWREDYYSARQALAKYFIEAFDLPPNNAEQVAETHLNQASAAYLLIPMSFEASGSASVPKIPSLNDIRYVLSKSDYVPESWEMAIQRPALLEIFLNNRLDVNAGNGFGKTMLMYAAQLNRPDVIRMLLKRGAKVSLRTQTVDDQCGVSIKGGRDALSYAAENAGIEAIRLLLKAGASETAVDTQQHDPAYYLAGNPYVTETQRKLPLRELAKIKQTIESDIPSFPCTDKLGPLEKLMCSSPALARRDRELALAFDRWEGLFVGAETREEKMKSQRNWLHRRDQECIGKSTSEEQETCLHIITSARIRYLFERAKDTTSLSR